MGAREPSVHHRTHLGALSRTLAALSKRVKQVSVSSAFKVKGQGGSIWMCRNEEVSTLSRESWVCANRTYLAP